MPLLRLLIDIIYPPRCIICGRFLWNGPLTRDSRSPFFCRECMADFHAIASPMCPVCGRPFSSGAAEDHLCEDCLRKRPFYHAAWAPYHYEGAILKAVHRLKYGCKDFAAKGLGPLLARFAAARLEDLQGLVVMPVPLHPRRLRERGFNQSLLLARHVSQSLSAELDFLSLRRVRYTQPQARLSKEERGKNVRGAFQLRHDAVIRGRPILLVDDVVTTGNTINECARILRKGGAQKIYGLSLARTSR